VPKEEVGKVREINDSEEIDNNPMQDSPHENSLKRKREKSEYIDLNENINNLNKDNDLFNKHNDQNRITPVNSEADVIEKEDNFNDKIDNLSRDKDKTKMKVLSLQEAKKKMSGFERRFC